MLCFYLGSLLSQLPQMTCFQTRCLRSCNIQLFLLQMLRTTTPKVFLRTNWPYKTSLHSILSETFMDFVFASDAFYSNTLFATFPQRGSGHAKNHISQVAMLSS